MAGAWVVEMQGMGRYLFTQRQQLLLIADPNRNRPVRIGAIRTRGDHQIELRGQRIDIVDMNLGREISVRPASPALWP